jgi:hypothetical protein
MKKLSAQYLAAEGVAVVRDRTVAHTDALEE